MKKMKMRLDDLVVSSFEVLSERTAPRGTVRGLALEADSPSISTCPLTLCEGCTIFPNCSFVSTCSPTICDPSCPTWPEG